MQHVTPAQKRIAFVCPRFAEGATVGGAETLLKALAQQAVAAANGYVNGSNDTTVTVSFGANTITVDVTRPHRNYFSGVLGFNSWNVSTTATVLAGWPNGAYGAMPLIFNQEAFNDPANRNAESPRSFSEPGTGSEDVPTGTSQFNWTVFGTAEGNSDNENTRVVRDLTFLAEERHNIIPLLEDANHPERYASLLTAVDVVYQDIAQRDQVAIFLKNLRFLKPGGRVVLDAGAIERLFDRHHVGVAGRGGDERAHRRSERLVGEVDEDVLLLDTVEDRLPGFELGQGRLGGGLGHRVLRAGDPHPGRYRGAGADLGEHPVHTDAPGADGPPGAEDELPRGGARQAGPRVAAHPAERRVQSRRR